MLRKRTVPCFLLMLFGCLPLPFLCSAQAVLNSTPGEPLAVVGGRPIYEQDLAPAIGPGLLDLRKQEYKMKSEALNQAIRKKLIEVEASKEGLSTEGLLRKQVDSKVAEPSDEEAKGYYLAVKSESTLPFEQIKPQVKQLLKNAEVQQEREKYADSLRDKTTVAILLQPPTVHLDYDPKRVDGSAEAPITIVEFADFECPFCSRAQPLLKDVLAKYQGKVKLAFLDFPLSPIHPHAETAAEASRCALDAGKYWQMHDAMFADQSKLDEAALVKTAIGLGIDQNTFSSCLKSGKYKPAVQQDFQEGSQAGVNATPSFFINGEFLSGVQSETDLTAIIDRQLHAAAMAGKTTATTTTQASR